MASAKTTTTQASRIDELRAQIAAAEAERLEAEAQIAAAEAERLEAEAQIAQIRADEAKAEADRIRKQGAASAPGR